MYSIIQGKEEHKNWPERLRGFVGRSVRLIEDHITKEGTLFAAGETIRCCGYDAKLWLHFKADDGRKISILLWAGSYLDFELLPATLGKITSK